VSLQNKKAGGDHQEAKVQSENRIQIRASKHYEQRDLTKMQAKN
jgi:hypothetical protein